jgi:hypothetical protein
MGSGADHPAANTVQPVTWLIAANEHEAIVNRQSQIVNDSASLIPAFSLPQLHNSFR